VATVVADESGEAEATNGEAEATGEPPPANATFRFDTLQLVEPHLFAGDGSGNQMDVTPVFNQLLAAALHNDDTGDGYADIWLVLAFDAALPLEDVSGDVVFANALCPVDDNNDRPCVAVGSAAAVRPDVRGPPAGSVLEPDPDRFADPANAPDKVESSCFSTPEADVDVEIVMGKSSIPLRNVEIAAYLVGDPADALEGGLMRGFVTEADAANTVISAGKQEYILGDLLRAEDMDGGSVLEPGWYFYVTFTALPTPWEAG
jgi:hypothetical protein